MKRRIRVGRRPGRGRLLAWALPLACLLPLSASAVVVRSADNGDDDPTGDPLDTNDFGSGGGQGDGRPHDPRWPGVHGVVLPGPVIDGRRVLLVPVNLGGLLVFRLVIIDEVVVTQEAADAR